MTKKTSFTHITLIDSNFISMAETPHSFNRPLNMKYFYQIIKYLVLANPEVEPSNGMASKTIVNVDEILNLKSLCNN